jgi:hypothetical protein
VQLTAASSEHASSQYEGWLLYDIGHCQEALSKAEKSIPMQRSFEAFFLKAYVLADSGMDPVAELLFGLWPSLKF